MNNDPSFLEIMFPEYNPKTFIISKKDSVITSYHIDRKDVSFSRNLDGIQRLGVYVLFGNNSIYIGQTSYGIQRIFDHVREKDFWTYAVLFLSDSRNFSREIISGLEKIMIEDAFENSPYIVNNREVPKYNIDNLSDRHLVNKFYKEIKFILNFQGIKTEKEEKEIAHNIPKKGIGSQANRRTPFKFKNLNIPIGSKITFIEDPSLDITVADENQGLKYNEKIISVCKLAKELKHADYELDGRPFFSFNNQNLLKIIENENSNL